MDSESLQYKSIEWLRFVMAAAVVLLHAGAGGGFGGATGLSSAFCIITAQGVCRLAVPFFFFVSGYLFFYKFENWDLGVWWSKVRRRGRTLLIPYILWNTIAVAILFGWSYYVSVSHGLEPVSFHEMVSNWGGIKLFWDTGEPLNMPLDYPLWFVRDLMVFVIVSPVVFFFVKLTKMPGLIITILYYLTLGKFASNIPIFIAGAYLSINKMNIVTTFHRYAKWDVMLTLILLVALVFTYDRYDSYRYFLRAFTVTGVISIFNITSDLINKGIVAVHPFLTRCSFFLFCLHGIVLRTRVPLRLTSFLQHYNNEMAKVAIVLLLFFISLFACMACFFVMDRITPRTLSLLTGGRKRTK